MTPTAISTDRADSLIIVATCPIRLIPMFLEFRPKGGSTRFILEEMAASVFANAAEATAALEEWKECMSSDDAMVREMNVRFISRRTMWDTHEEAVRALLPGEIVADQGPNVWPRYNVIVPPAVGDPVSYAFNGDYYPDGEVVHVTPGTFRVVKTSTGSVYYRRKESAAWIKKGGTWGLVAGHVSRRNPEF